MKKLYFAYGSNMSQSRLEERVGKVTKVGTRTINGWKLTFNAGNERAFVNMEVSININDFVEGVVYELTPRQLRRLDTFEGAPYLYQRVVFTEGLKDLFAYVSLNPRYRTKMRPDREYLQHIIKGCQENKLNKTFKNILSLI